MMLSPFGVKPFGSSKPVTADSNVILLEDGATLLLEDGTSAGEE